MDTEKTQKRLTRRQTIGLAGSTGAALVASGAPLGLLGSRPPGLDAEEAAAASCTLAPKLTQGPYWVDERLHRSNIVAGQSGVALKLKIYVLRADEECAPQQGAYVDIWHCNAGGEYSEESVQGTSGQTFLRGYQVTDADGSVTFKTIWPGWYSGRTIHIHVRVRTFSGDDTTYNFPTQIFFAEVANNAVLARSAYDTRSPQSRDTTNAADSIYAEAKSKGNVLLVTPSGSVGAGYNGTATISLSGLPEGSSSQDTAVRASLRSLKIHRHRGKRSIELRLRARERVSADAQLRRGGAIIARKRIGSLAKGGTRTLTVPVPDHVKAGKANLALTLLDSAGNSKTVKRKLHLPGRA